MKSVNINYKIILLSLFIFFITIPSFSQGTVHVIHYADTKGITDIAKSWKEGKSFVNYEIVEGIRQYSGMHVEYYSVTGDKFKKGDMANHLSNIATNSQDVILFFYEGRAIKSEGIWPNFSFTETEGAVSLDYGVVYQILKTKKHRLILMFANIYNDIIDSNSSGRRQKPTIAIEDAKGHRYHELFQNYSGDLIMSSSKKGQSSYAVKGEMSYFFTAFMETLHKAVNTYAEASWETIKNEIQDKTTKYAAEDGKTQTPIYHIDLKNLHVNVIRKAYSWEDLEVVEKNEKYGFIDKYGKAKIPFIYDYAAAFRDGLARVKKNEKYGFIDKDGNTKIPFIYVRAWSFRDGLARVKDKGKYGFISKDGKIKIPCTYERAWDFREGQAAVKKNGKFFNIDKTGKCMSGCN